MMTPFPSTRAVSGKLLLTSAVLTLASVLILMAQAARAQTLTVLYRFQNGDGYRLSSGVTLDRGGKLYGTTNLYGYGTVYQLKRAGSGYVFNQLYAFQGMDGAVPTDIVFGADGVLYGTTREGGTGNDGAVYKLRPPATPCKTALCPWTENTLFSFDFSDGGQPLYGALAFDNAGSVYGTTQYGGDSNNGVAYELSRTGNRWTQTVLHSFSGRPGDGENPQHNVILDSAGNLYGTTLLGGPNGEGTVFELVPNGSGWTENILVSFPVPGMETGGVVAAGLIMDRAGNLYGATGGHGDGSSPACIFELSSSDNSWRLSVLHCFELGFGEGGPTGNLVMDNDGSLYDYLPATPSHLNGSIFKLSPSPNGWIYTDLYDFFGEGPIGDLTMDANGNLYGATNEGAIWILTP